MSSLEEDLAAIARIESVPTILKTIRETTGLRLTLVARVTQDRWVAAAVLDEMNFGLSVGGELDVATTLCSEVRDQHKPIVIDDATIDPIYINHPTPKMYAFKSYVAMPLFRKNGEYFGNVCGLDSEPRKLKDEKTISMLTLFAKLISLQLEAEERHAGQSAALEGERALSKLREQFIAVLGHDVRNPLSSINMGVDLLGQRIQDSDAQRIIARIRNSTKRIAGLVDDVLDLARGRLGGGIATESVGVTDIVKRLEHVIAEVQAAHADRKIVLDVERDGSLDCDPKRIEQLVSNLLANALQHGEAGTPIKVVVDGSDERFELSVSNEGTPIPEASRALLFEPYFRGGHSERMDGGLGLGLYIVSEIAKSHRGKVSVDSANGRTTFRFEMPRHGA